MITLEQAKALKHGTTLYCAVLYNSDGSPARFRVNGKPKTWKRDHSRVAVPLKRGLYEYAYLDQYNLSDFCLTSEEAERFQL